MKELSVFLCLMCLVYANGFNLNPFSPQSWANFQRELMETINNSDAARYTLYNNNLQITKGVKNYRPEEMQVRISNNNIVMEGARMDENGKVIDKFITQYSLPSGHRPENVIAEFSKSQQMLTITSRPSQDPDINIPIRVVD